MRRRARRLRAHARRLGARLDPRPFVWRVVGAAHRVVQVLRHGPGH